MAEETQSAFDLIWGAENIGRELNMTRRQVFYALESGVIPAKKVGNRWVVERGKLREFFLEGAEAA